MKTVIPSSILSLNKLFNDNDRKLYVVGGAVRDFMIGHIPKDFDLSTNALPDEIIKIVKGRYKCNERGKDFGVVVVFPPDYPDGFEIATFRSDIYDGKLGLSRNPKVKFTTIEDDCARRDLTINAMFYDIELGEIIDYVGGKSDIELGICKFVGESLLRITEDPLRIMRIIRFAARYDFTIPDDTKSLIRENSHMLSIIVKERIVKEIKSAFDDCGDFSIFMSLMMELNIFEVIFPGYELHKFPIKSTFLEIHLAFLLQHIETNTTIENDLVKVHKMDSSMVHKIIFLNNIFNFDPDNVLDIYKFRNAKNITDELLSEWLSLFDNYPSYLDAFVKYRPSVSCETLIINGFLGKELGNEQRRLESIQFKKI